MEIVPIIDPKTLHIIRYEKRSIVRANKLWHLSSLIFPVNEKTGKILIQTRPRGKTYEGKLDVFGGFVNKSAYTEKLRNNFEIEILKKIFHITAVREANEELKIYVANVKRHISEKDLSLLKPLGGFIANDEILREISSVYLLSIPRGASVETFDEINGKNVSTTCQYFDFKYLLSLYYNSPDKLSSSISRVISNYISNKKIRDEIDKITKSNGESLQI